MAIGSRKDCFINWTNYSKTGTLIHIEDRRRALWGNVRFIGTLLLLTAFADDTSVDVSEVL